MVISDVFVYAEFFALLCAVGAASSCIAAYCANRYKGDKKRLFVSCFLISVAMTAAIVCFFGLSSYALKGIILCLILLFASYSDIKSRECDDFIHVMILIAAFIGIRTEMLPDMILAAMFVFSVMILAILVSKSNIGGADLKLSVACAFMLGSRQGIFGFVLSLVIAVAVNLIKEKNKKAAFPLIPYLSIGFMTAYFLK